MKPRVRLSTWGIVTLVLVLGLMASGIAAAAPMSVVYPDPTNSVLELGTATDIEIWVNDVTDFYGVEFELTYNDSIVHALSVAPGAAFTDHPGEYEVVQNEILAGTIRFAASLLATPKAPALTGDLHVATITFLGAATGTSPLAFTEVKVANSSGQAVSYAYLDGSIIVAILGDVQGYAYLEGRTNHSLSTVDIVNGTTAGTVTASNGYYKFVDVMNGTYDVTIDHSMYLNATGTCQATGSGTTTWPSVTLLAGDLNDDNSINILDLVLCAANFNTVYAPADVNADGIVDIFDVVLIGKNFGMSGPTNIPCP